MDNQPPVKVKWGLWLGNELISEGETELEAADNAIKSMIDDKRIDSALHFKQIMNDFLLKPIKDE